MDIKPSFNEFKNKFDVNRHCVICCKVGSKDKLVSTEDGMQNLRHAAQIWNDVPVLSRIQNSNKFSQNYHYYL